MRQLRQHICRSFRSAESRRQFMNQRHLQNKPLSHDLGLGRDHMSNLRAQEFGDSQAYYTHVRLTHLLFPAPTIRENRCAQPAPQSTRHKQHPRFGHEREPWVHQEERQSRRGRAKAASTNRQPNQAARKRASRGSVSVLTKPKGDGEVEKKGLNKIFSRPSSICIKR